MFNSILFFRYKYHRNDKSCYGLHICDLFKSCSRFVFFKKKNCFVWFPKIHYFVVVECQVHKIRGLFFKAILRQDIGWYDTHQTGDFAAKMAEWANLALLLFLKNFYMLSTCSESFFFEIAEIWTNSRKVLERKSECLFSLSLFSPPVWSMPSITDGNSLWLF